MAQPAAAAPAEKTIGVALLGAGIFARTGLLPAILAPSSPFKLLAVYSRSRASVQALLDNLPASLEKPEAYHEEADPTTGSPKPLSTLLARSDISSVIMALPILSQPALVAQCLEAGKHVLSEKPVAGDCAQGRELLNSVSGKCAAMVKGAPVWMVAENYRFESGLERAAELAKRIGSLVTFTATWHLYVTPNASYHATAWRTVPDYQG
ncbi:hypothetical protein HDU67_005441, partial [Dinochytrium kinnereticum]